MNKLEDLYYVLETNNVKKAFDIHIVYYTEKNMSIGYS